MASGCASETVRWSIAVCLPAPKTFSASIWRRIAWVETLTEGTAMRSSAPKSRIVFTAALRVLRFKG